MYTPNEISEINSSDELLNDYATVQQSLVNWRIKQPLLIERSSRENLCHYVEAVLSSSVQWRERDRMDLCGKAAEIAEALSLDAEDLMEASRLRFRSALLYELAGTPSLAASILHSEDVPKSIYAFFQRSGEYQFLNGAADLDAEPQVEESNNLADLALIDDARAYAYGAQQRSKRELASLDGRPVSSDLACLASNFDFGISATEASAFAAVIRDRVERSTVTQVRYGLIDILHSIHFPIELLPAQVSAVRGGLLEKEYPSWGFASPTGSGKTFVARLAIADLLYDRPESKIVYVVPSRALVSEVGADLQRTFDELGYKTLALSAQLIELDEDEAHDLADASIVVMTPEKADLLLRLNHEFIARINLVIVDEAHHIESGTRGALLEWYLWRLIRVVPGQSRYLFLSAVAPNIDQIAKWVDTRGTSKTFPHRPTRMRVGIYNLEGTGKKARGTIRYADGNKVELINSEAEKGIRKGIAQLADAVSSAGPVLIVAKGKRECENIAEELYEWLKKTGELDPLDASALETREFKRLDSSLEREMYAEVPLRRLTQSGIAYHHAGLPPRVREDVERAIRGRLVNYVVATTTLAEGVNFPFSTVIVQSLALRDPPEVGRKASYSPVTPREFWNIAGRAGRPGFDPEGQVILFEPSLGLDKIKHVIDPYLQPNISEFSPVKSALAEGLAEVHRDLAANEYTATDLEKIQLPARMSRRARGAINLVRIGLVHARASEMTQSPDEILSSTFAAQFLDEKEYESAVTVFSAQEKATQAYVESDEAFDLASLAELGLALETLDNIREYVRRMENWQIKNLNKLFFGSEINFDQVGYVVGPVAKRMSELEGQALGGFLSEVIVQWLSGVPFTSIRSNSSFEKRLEDLIAVIHSRVQFLLPWGLWAADWVIDMEARHRGINYDGEVKKLAYLADSGVPSFDALRLGQMGLERVDSTRISRAYKKEGGLETGVDIVDWLAAQNKKTVTRIIRGQDGRRVDFEFFEKVARLSQGGSRHEG